MEPVRGHRNQRVVEAARLHRARERRASGRTLIEGPNLLEDALASGVSPEVVFALDGDDRTSHLCEEHGLELVRVGESALVRLAGTKTPRGPVAVIEIPTSKPGAGLGLLVAWGVSDPGNVGTLVRTAAAFSWDFGHTVGTSDPWSPKVLRAGAGGHFRSGIRAVESLADLEGYVPIAAVVDGGIPPSRLDPGRYALLVGEEASGLPPEVVEGSELKVTIPMPGGQESLNAAMAAGMIVYELSKPEREGEGQV
jgi:TrmH family RNA methyltransferase